MINFGPIWLDWYIPTQNQNQKSNSYMLPFYISIQKFAKAIWSFTQVIFYPKSVPETPWRSHFRESFSHLILVCYN